MAGEGLKEMLSASSCGENVMPFLDTVVNIVRLKALERQSGILCEEGRKAEIEKAVSETQKDVDHAAGSSIGRFLANKLLSHAKMAEPAITADMRKIEAMGAKLVGLAFRIKSFQSLSEKIVREAEEKVQSLRQAAEGITDVLRYTVTATAERYAELVPKAIRHLVRRGYKVMNFRNAWGGRFYQGINVHFLSPTGVRVEVQFHTPESFVVKQASHEVYEIRRSAAATQVQGLVAVRLSLAYNALVRPPKGAQSIAWSAAGIKQIPTSIVA